MFATLIVRITLISHFFCIAKFAKISCTKVDLFYPCDLNCRTAYLPAEESALLFITTFDSRTSWLLRSVIDWLLS